MNFTCRECKETKTYVTGGTEICYPCAGWLAWLEKPQYSIRILGHHYTLGTSKPEDPRHWKGMGGKVSQIRFHDGRILETDDLWHQGEIPKHLRERLPDNASFVTP